MIPVRASTNDNEGLIGNFLERLNLQLDSFLGIDTVQGYPEIVVLEVNCKTYRAFVRN